MTGECERLVRKGRWSYMLGSELRRAQLVMEVVLYGGRVKRVTSRALPGSSKTG